MTASSSKDADVFQKNNISLCKSTLWFCVLPGRQCVSLSMVVAMFLCCTRHCFSSSMELMSWKEGVKKTKSPKTNPD